VYGHRGLRADLTRTHRAAVTEQPSLEVVSCGLVITRELPGKTATMATGVGHL
jgi:hypothetical protein